MKAIMRGLDTNSRTAFQAAAEGGAQSASSTSYRAHATLRHAIQRTNLHPAAGFQGSERGTRPSVSGPLPLDSKAMNAPLRSRRRASRPLTLDDRPRRTKRRLALAELALSLAKADGADFADIRLGATFQEFLRRATTGSNISTSAAIMGLRPARAARRLLGLLWRAPA